MLSGDKSSKMDSFMVNFYLNFLTINLGRNMQHETLNLRVSRAVLHLKRLVNSRGMNSKEPRVLGHLSFDTSKFKV